MRSRRAHNFQFGCTEAYNERRNYSICVNASIDIDKRKWLLIKFTNL
nr:MAG TPA: hypothetical protein [Caudoviricetes sp.]